MTVQTTTHPALLGFPSPDELQSIEAQVERYAKSNLLPSAIRGKAADVFTVLMVARDLGLPATSGLFKVHVVEGKPTLAADLMVALLLSHGHDVWPGDECNGEAATYYGKRRSSDRVVSITYTLEEARAAGLANKDNWKKNPAAMLRARASSALCRVLAPDVLGGIASSVEEAQDEANAAPTQVSFDQAVERLKAAGHDVDGIVDAEIVPPTPDPDPTDATGEVTERLAQLAEQVAAADTTEALADIWRQADAEALLDDPNPSGGPNNGIPLRALITEAVEQLRAGGSQ